MKLKLRFLPYSRHILVGEGGISMICLDILFAKLPGKAISVLSFKKSQYNHSCIIV